MMLTHKITVHNSNNGNAEEELLFYLIYELI